MLAEGALEEPEESPAIHRRRADELPLGLVELRDVLVLVVQTDLA